MEDDEQPPSRELRISINTFKHVEHAVYIAIGLLLGVTAVAALFGATASAWEGIADWKSGSVIPLIIERLLFVLMITEILHTVRISIRSGSLTCEPFLVVGLIACIRRVLVITLESSEGARKSGNAEAEGIFRSSMIELGVLAALILVMVVSIYLLQRSGQAKSNPSAT